MGLVQGSERDERVQPGKDSLVHPHRIREFLPAMDHPVAGSDESLLKGCIIEPVEQCPQGLGLSYPLPLIEIIIDQNAPCRLLNLKVRPPAQILDPALAAQGKLVRAALNKEEGKLDAGRTGIEDEDLPADPTRLRR